jgi:Ser/Thr protein kinase RdoA (MazF antagonist)
VKEHELPLRGGASTDGVVRVGGTVRRPPHRTSATMRAVLRHLERARFDAAPRWLGFDERGRDVLTWIHGDSFGDAERGRLHPYLGQGPHIEFTDEQLVAALRLLRRYHDTFREDELVCHGDFGPWNLVWRGGVPVAVIDFDQAHPGARTDDVAYALRMFVSFGLVDVDPRELARRSDVALRAYGMSFDVPAILRREYDAAEARCRANGWHRQLAKLPRERGWLEQHGSLL